jgi:hypothetical protein
MNTPYRPDRFWSPPSLLPSELLGLLLRPIKLEGYDYIVASCCTVLFDNFIGYVAVFRADRQQEKTKHAHVKIEIKENATRTDTN